MKKQLTLLLAIATTTGFSQEWKPNSTHTSLYAQDQFGGFNIKGVGIGIINPTARLEVFGRVKLHSVLNIDSILTAGNTYTINGLTGAFKNSAWSGIGNRIIQTDASGNLMPLAQGSTTQVLYGNATWGALPLIPANIWQGNATSSYYMGKVGIGTGTPSVALDVVGSTQISNAIKVGALSGSGNRFLQTDASGNVLPFAMGTSTQVLYGNGIWGALPSAPAFSNSTSCIPNVPLWSMGGDNFTAIGSLTQAAIGTCNNADFVLKSHGNNRAWFKQDGTISFGSNLNSTTGGKEYRFHAGALRLSGDNSFGGAMIVFDGGANINGDWGIEYQPTQFAKPGLNFWKPWPSPNSSNYQLFLADDGMIGVGTANPLSRFDVDAWGNDGITVRTNAGKKAFSSINKNTNQETFSINADGKTKIGATGSTDTLLTVNGTLKTTNAIANTIKVNSLAGTNNRILQADANGNLVELPQGTNNQVLLGNGTWGTLPNGTQQSVFTSTVAGVAYYNGKIGINNNNPFTALDINGDLRVSQNVYVGGGLLISDLVNATTELRGLDIKADRDLVVQGFSKFKADVQVVGTASLNNVVIDSTLTTSALRLGTGANAVDLKTQSLNGINGILNLGYGTIHFPPATCLAPVTSGDFYTQRLTIKQPALSTSTNLLDFRNDGTNGYIDFGFDNNIFPKIAIDVNGDPVVGTTPPAPVLKINGDCHGDVEIAKGGGVLSAGRWFEVGNPTRAFNVASNIKANGTGIGQRVTANSPYPDNNTSLPFTYNTQLFVNKNRTHALSVFNTATNTNGDELFAVFGNGKTQINTPDNNNDNKYFVVNNTSNSSSPVETFAVSGSGYTRINVMNPTAMDNVFDIFDNTSTTNAKYLFRVKTNGHVYAREVEILNTAMAFPDYVFAKDYKMLSLPDLEAYINTNKHLPNFETAKYYETNGIKSSEMFVKQQEKIEELTLYIIELEKRMKALEQTIKK